MATKQTTGSRTSGAKRTPAKKTSTRSTSSSRSRTGSAKPAAKRQPAGPSFGELLGQAFDGHGHDVTGVAAILVGVVTGLGLYAGLAGPLGNGLATAARAGFGLAAYVVPVALVVLGALLVRGPRPPRVDEESGEVLPGRSPVRLAVGSVLLTIAVTGLLHALRGHPSFGAPAEDFHRAGGYLGAAVGNPLVAVLAVPGAVIVLLGVAVIGLVVITATPVRVAADRTATGFAPVRNAFSRAWRSLFELGSRPEGEDGDEPTIDLREPEAPAVVVAGEEAEPTKPKKPRKKKEEAPELHAPDPDAEPEHAEQLAIDLGPAVKGSPWKLPSMKLLGRSEAQSIDTAAVEALGHTLEAALAAHGVETRLVGMVVGPTVTRYELELGPGVKVARVTSLNKDIAYAMASPDVRILAPIPGRQAIGVEVPNQDRQVVSLGDILASDEARKATHPLEVAVGRDINGRAMLVNLATMPHVLIAGATGAGKSSCINSLLTSILMRATPDQVRLILIDPKRVELGQYNRLPHLLTQVVTNPKKAANALSWTVKEMERRYDLLAEVGFRDINGYNSAFDRGELTRPGELDVDDGRPTYERLPYILVVVDELNDLMMVAARDVEESICRIAQMARAVGIHLVIATQRPSVNVITGVIKANVPARFAFAVSSLADSRVILDQPGAERLVGKGDMLLLGPSSNIAQRIQGCWVSEKEVRAAVSAWLRQAPETQYLDGVEAGPAGGGDDVDLDDLITADRPGGAGGGGDDDDDDLLYQAMELVVRSQLGSTSMLQRKLRVGFARAGRLMDLLEERGVVGPSEGSKARAVLMTVDELEETLASR